MMNHEHAVIAQDIRIRICKTTPDDLAYVLQQERLPENAEFVGQWTEAQHLAALDDDDCGHWIIEAQIDFRKVGYMILRGLTNPHGSVECMRLAISEKAQGFGRAALRLMKQIVFEHFHAHRLWLDVRDFNTRARGLYESEGFVVEGILRECQKWQGRYSSLVVLSLLEEEWRTEIRP
jgi:RimJ/RimL family protein N-acetyltransferase